MAPGGEEEGLTYSRVNIFQRDSDFKPSDKTCKTFLLNIPMKLLQLIVTGGRECDIAGNNDDHQASEPGHGGSAALQRAALFITGLCLQTREA